MTTYLFKLLVKYHLVQEEKNISKYSRTKSSIFFPFLYPASDERKANKLWIGQTQLDDHGGTRS